MLGCAVLGCVLCVCIAMCERWEREVAPLVRHHTTPPRPRTLPLCPAYRHSKTHMQPVGYLGTAVVCGLLCTAIAWVLFDFTDTPGGGAFLMCGGLQMGVEQAGGVEEERGRRGRAAVTDLVSPLKPPYPPQYWSSPTTLRRQATRSTRPSEALAPPTPSA